jgi:hypothetical protein
MTRLSRLLPSSRRSNRTVPDVAAILRRVGPQAVSRRVGIRSQGTVTLLGVLAFVDGGRRLARRVLYTRRHAPSPEAFQGGSSRRTPEKEEERSKRGEARRGEAGAAIQEARRRVGVGEPLSCEDGLGRKCVMLPSLPFGTGCAQDSPTRSQRVAPKIAALAPETMLSRDGTEAPQKNLRFECDRAG